MSRKWPLGLTLFSSTALAIVLAVAIIPVPAAVATASQFANPLTVSSYSDKAVTKYAQSFIEFVPVNALLTMRNYKPVPAWLFVDLRTGKQIRIAVGDLLPVRFADGSTMHLVFMGVPPLDGYFFRAVAGTLRPPGVPMFQPTDSKALWLIGYDGSGGSGVVDLGGGSTLTYVTGGASCISGNVSMCGRPPQMASY